MWVVTPHILRAMVSFHNKVTCQISGRMHQRPLNRVWDYLPIEEALEEAGMEKFVAYATL